MPNMFARYGALACALWVLAGAARVHGELMPYEPNNSPNKAAILPVGQLVISDGLDGSSGRPDTLLGVYDPAFHSLSLVDDNGNPAPNHKASQLLGVPLRANGSAYFRLSGTGDTNFSGDHGEKGRYSVLFEIRDPQHNLVKTLPMEFEDINPGMSDNLWIDPDNGLSDWTGYTADVTVNNIVGAGSGDSLDYWLFTGLQPFEEFTVAITTATFHPLIGYLNSSNALVDVSNPADTLPMLTGTADAQGRVRIGVTGVADLGFKGEHVAVGQYTLALTPANTIPEPSSVVLAGLGGVLALVWARRRSRRRRA